MSELSQAVFLSYASQDAAAAQRLCDALRAAGVEVWFDQNELGGGDAWDAKIRKQIAECALFVPVISANTQARLEGYFRIEWKLAARRTHAMATAKAFLLPVVIDATSDAEAHVPDEFRDVQWTRLPGAEAPEKFCARVQTLLGSEGRDASLRRQSANASENSEHPAKAPLPKRSSKWLVAGAVVLATLIVGTGLYFSLHPRRSPEEIANHVANAQSIAASQIPPHTGELKRLSEARQLVAKAWVQLNKQEFARAELETADALCKRAADLDPVDAEVWATWAQVHSWMSHFRLDRTDARKQKARDCVARAIRIDPGSFEARLAQAVFWTRGGGANSRSSETSKLLRELVQERPNDPRCLLIAGQYFMGPKETRAEGLAQLERLAANPDYTALAWVEIGWIWHNRENDMRQALAAAEKSIAAKPYWHNLGLKAQIAATWLGDLDLALKTLRMMPQDQQQEDWSVGLQNLILMLRRKPKEWLNFLNGVSQEWLSSPQFTGPKAYLTGLARREDGAEELARRDFKRALELTEKHLATLPDSQDLLALRAMCLKFAGEEAEAAKAYQVFLQIKKRSLMNPYLLFESRDRAFELLAKEKWFSAELRLFPHLDPFRDDPRFAALRAEADADPMRSPAATPASSAAKTQDPFAAPQANRDAKSVAVLAFKNLSGDPAREFFSDGLSEAVTDVLGRVPGLKVVGSASAFSFKGKSVPIPEIARQLGVTHLVEGTVVQDGQTVRITAKLIQADGFQVWVSDKLERDAKNIFALHDEVSGLIAKNLSLKLGASSAAATATVNPEAFELYVQARQAWSLRTVEGFAEAELQLKKALVIEPDFARAHAALSDVWTTGAGAGASLGLFRLRDSPMIRKSAAAADRAIQLDPQLAEAHAALGNVAWNDWRIADAAAALRTAVTLNSNYASAHQWLGRVLATDGRMDEALAALRRAHDLEPLSHKIADNLAIILFSAGRFSEALALADRAQALQPNSIWAAAVRVWALAELGQGDAALAAVRSVTGENPATWKGHVVFALARAGARSEAQAMLDRIAPADRSASAAAASLVLGRADDCWSALEQGSRNILSADALLFWPVFDSIRAEARFQNMLATLGLTEAHARAQAWRAANPPERAARP